ncbi:hypothetical protein [Streptomyces guryensis]|uniref:Uncharacterized protein n=1 Tax=Streptomyces guryensis TaxID=2886947 RepID=A0A9Q3VVI9_9ACTN|nr:hypothetical protein [Streptomyces guryensis]MCD9880758.1 hypothetical protein [Streptomyces guryensis]
MKRLDGPGQRGASHLLPDFALVSFAVPRVAAASASASVHVGVPGVLMAWAVAAGVRAPGFTAVRTKCTQTGVSPEPDITMSPPPALPFAVSAAADLPA